MPDEKKKEPKEPTDVRWNRIAASLLVGRTVKAVSYMSKKEAEDSGWDQRALVIEFDNGLCIYPSQDDEGNNAGALFTNNDKQPVLPVLWNF